MTSMVQGTHLAEDPPARRRWTASTRHGHPGPTLGPEKEEIGSAQMPYATVNPYTNELVKSFPDATDEEVDAVLDRAQEAYRSWSRVPVAERCAIFTKASQLVLERKEELARLATLEMGKLYGESLGEVGEHRGGVVLDLAEGLAVELAHLEGGQAGEFLLALEDQLRRLGEDRAPLGDRHPAPGPVCLLGPVQYGVHLLVGRVGERLDELIGVRVDRCVRHLRAPYLFLLGSEGRAWMSMTCGGRPPTPSRRVLREMRPLNHRRHVPSSRCRYIGADTTTVAPNV